MLKIYMIFWTLTFAITVYTGILALHEGQLIELKSVIGVVLASAVAGLIPVLNMTIPIKLAIANKPTRDFLLKLLLTDT